MKACKEIRILLKSHYVWKYLNIQRKEPISWMRFNPGVALPSRYPYINLLGEQNKPQLLPFHSNYIRNQIRYREMGVFMYTCWKKSRSTSVISIVITSNKLNWKSWHLTLSRPYFSLSNRPTRTYRPINSFWQCRESENAMFSLAFC
jgi:hypothetical protein